MSILEQLVAEYTAMKEGRQVKATTGTPSTPYLHGPGGLFGVSGLERDIFSAFVNAQGLASALPVSMSTKTDPLFGYITGFQAATGTQPNPTTDPCGAFPVAGAIKGCLQTAQFGKYGFCTRELDLSRLGKITDRGEFLDLRVVNSPMVSSLAGSLFQGLPGDQAVLAGQDFLARLLEVGVQFQWELSGQLYVGAGTTNEFPGLDVLISTNKIDALDQNSTCESLDSDIKDFNYSCIGDSDAANDIVRVLTTMWRYLNHNASTMNFGMVEWAIVMRKNLFHEITDVWPCAYNTYRCQMGFEAENGRVFVDGNEQRRFSDEMRNGSFLRIDGQDVPVIVDDFIEEESNDTPGVALGPGQYASDIYMVPLTVRGGTPVTFWEVFNYQNAPLQTAIQRGRLNDYFWSDGGRYLWSKQSPTGTCVQWCAQIEPRVILRTPQLAGRIQNVCYEPLQHLRDPEPDDYYFVDGGVTTSRAAPSYWSDWNLPA